MKVALIGLGGDTTKSIIRECIGYFKKADFLDIRKLKLHISSDSVEVFYDDNNLEDYDCVYCRGSHKYALLLTGITEALNSKCYMPVSSNAFLACHNKFLTSMELQKANILMPRTFLASNSNAAKKILEEIHYPVIIKIPSGTHGKGVMFADSRSSAKSVIDTLEVFNQSYIIQEYVETDATDIRAVVLGDRVISAMKRKAAKDELRANLHMGGMGIATNVSEEVERLAVRSAKALGLDICAVDLLEGAKTSVLEVNVSPGLRGISEVTKRNIARDVAKFLYDKTCNFKNIKKKEGYDDIINGLDKKINNQFLSNLDIKLGRIRLPGAATKLSGLTEHDEVMIKADRGKIIITKSDVK